MDKFLHGSTKYRNSDNAKRPSQETLQKMTMPFDGMGLQRESFSYDICDYHAVLDQQTVMNLKGLRYNKQAVVMEQIGLCPHSAAPRLESHRKTLS